MKSRIATNEPKEATLHLPVVRRARRPRRPSAPAPWNPNAHAFCAQQQHADIGRSGVRPPPAVAARPAAGTSPPPPAPPPAASRFHGVAHGVLPFLDVLVKLRTNFGMRTTSRNDAGISGQRIGGRRLARHAGQHQPIDLVFPPVANPRGRGVFLFPVFRLGGCLAMTAATAEQGRLQAESRRCPASRICKRPPSLPSPRLTAARASPGNGELLDQQQGRERRHVRLALGDRVRRRCVG